MNNITEKIKLSLSKRQRSEKRFKFLGFIGISFAILFLIIILYSIFSQGQSAFKSTYIELNIFFDEKIIDVEGKRDIEDIKFANFRKIITNSLDNYFPEVEKREEKRKLHEFISSSEEKNLMNLVLSDQELIGKSKQLWLLASSTIDVIHKNPEMEGIVESDRLVDDLELSWFKTFKENGNLKFGFNKNFFAKADSTEPEQAGVLGSMLGSFFTLLVTLILSFPIAVAAGVFFRRTGTKK